MNVETFKYDNRIVRAFAIATVVWGIVGMSAGLLAAVQLFWPQANLNLQFVSFGRLRPLHTNAVIFSVPKPWTSTAATSKRSWN